MRSQRKIPSTENSLLVPILLACAYFVQIAYCEVITPEMLHQMTRHNSASGQSNTNASRPVAHDAGSSVGSNQTSCLGELDDRQLQMLESIKHITRSGRTPDEMVTMIHQRIDELPVSYRQKQALAGMVYGQLSISAQRTVALDGNGPFKKEVASLTNHGAKIVDGKLDLSGLDFSQLESLQHSLKTFFPESAAQISQINEQGAKPVFLGDQVIMPSSYGNNRIISQSDFQKQLKNLTDDFESGMRQFLEETNDAASMWKLAKNGLLGNTTAEKIANSRYNALNGKINYLSKMYGYSPDKTVELRNSIGRALQHQNGKLDASVSQFKWAAAAIAAAPLAWPILAIGGAAAGTGMAISGAISLAQIGGHAGISTARGHGDFMCNLGKQVLDKGPQGFLLALGGGILGGAGNVVKGASRLTQAGLKMLGLGEKTYKGITTTATGIMLAPGVYGTGKALLTIPELNKLAEVAEADGQSELAEKYRELAAKAKLDVAQGVLTTVALGVAAKYLKGKAKDGLAVASAEESPVVATIEASAAKLNMPKATVEKLLTWVPAGRQAELDQMLKKMAEAGGTLTKDDLLKLNRFLREFNAQDLFRFHTTREGTIDKILQSRINGPEAGVIKPGKGEGFIYTLDTPANLNKLGRFRTMSSSSAGKETIVFEGDAAGLFKPHPKTSFIGHVVKNKIGKEFVVDQQLVIDKFARPDPNTLVVTKAHLVPLTAEQARSARLGMKAIIYAPEAVVGGAGAYAGYKIFLSPPNSTEKQ